MLTLRLSLYLLPALTLSSCGGSADPDGFVDACLAQPNSNEDLCECIDEHTAENFTPDERDALYATWLPEDDPFRQEVEQRESYVAGLMTIISEGEAIVDECGGMPSM